MEIDLTISAVFLLAAGGLIALNLVGARTDCATRDQWTHFFAFRPRKLIDGTYAGGDLMRRWSRDGWQYRRETEDEALDRIDRAAW